MLQRYIRLICNICGAVTDLEEMNLLDGQQLRLRLKVSGWINRGRRDICPSCALKGGK